jgi:hypothetical protein
MNEKRRASRATPIARGPTKGTRYPENCCVAARLCPPVDKKGVWAVHLKALVDSSRQPLLVDLNLKVTFQSCCSRNCTQPLHSRARKQQSCVLFLVCLKVAVAGDHLGRGCGGLNGEPWSSTPLSSATIQESSRP